MTKTDLHEGPAVLNSADYMLLKKHFDTATIASRDHIEHIIGLAELLKNSAKESGLFRDITEELMLRLYKLLSQNMNMSFLCSEDKLPENLDAVQQARDSAEVINLRKVLTDIVDGCSEILAVQGGRHKIKLKIDTDGMGGEISAYAQIPKDLFTIAVMNLLQNAFLYSPPNSWVEVTLTRLKGNVRVSVNNPFGKDDERIRAYSVGENSANTELARLGHYLCAKIAACYGG
ncbi:MAG: hypothetical protein FWD35_04495, partial [Oscillospiraceae bacterium]|nr:hypothetical protein [Oscillospiraceae bacterium]